MKKILAGMLLESSWFVLSTVNAETNAEGTDSVSDTEGTDPSTSTDDSTTSPEGTEPTEAEPTPDISTTVDDTYDSRVIYVAEDIDVQRL